MNNELRNFLLSQFNNIGKLEKEIIKLMIKKEKNHLLVYLDEVLLDLLKSKCVVLDREYNNGKEKEFFVSRNNNGCGCIVN